MGILYVIATPIGNLEDISQRALETLKNVNLVLAEDTRVGRKLLNYYKINQKVISYHQHSKPARVREIISLLENGLKIALICDAGTPGISDPGNELIEKIIAELGDRVRIIPIPGPAALTAAASIAGFPMDKFLFLGFPPHKKKRNKFFKQVVDSEYPVIFYEAPYRIIKSLKELQTAVKNSRKKIELVVCRELTKKFETIYRGDIDKVIKEIEGDKIKGEFVIIAKSS